MVKLQLGDGVRLSFDSDFFDAIFMSFTLELFDTQEIHLVLQECHRALKNDGRICIVSLSKIRGGIRVKLYEWFHRKFPNIVDCRPIFVKQAVEDAGFNLINHIVTMMWGLPVEIVLAGKM
jgi:demethylmenaquinone methyltransferase/2-methoxy-6-polyprenyl-1,4-benzoquinol methylase